MLEELRKRQRESVGFLLIRAGQLWNERAIAKVNARAGTPVLRESHTRLLPLLMRPGGARLVDLARRLGLTKQSVQPLVRELKELGVVATQPDDLDGRAVRIVLTPRGLDGIDQGNDVLRQIEQELAGRFGKAEMKSLRGSLRRLLSMLEEEGD
jgi:DNA-binding MarR family transcriptional regulator